MRRKTKPVIRIRLSRRSWAWANLWAHQARRRRLLAVDSTIALMQASAPQGYWPMNDEVAPTTADLSGNNHTGTQAGGITLQQPGATANGKSTAFLTDGRVSMADHANLRFSGSEVITLEAFVKVNAITPGADQVIIQKGGVVTYNYQLMVTNTGLVAFGYRDASNVMHLMWTNAVITTGGVWMHVAAVYTFSSTSLVIYKNGVSQALHATGTAWDGTAPQAGTAVLWLGTNNNNAAWLNGNLAHVAVHRGALSQPVIASHAAKLAA